MSVAPIIVSGSASVKCVGLHIEIGDRREYRIILSVLQLVAEVSSFSVSPL